MHAGPLPGWPAAVLVLTDRTLTGGRPLADHVGGAPAVILREKDLPIRERLALAGQLRPCVEVLIVASAVSPDADGTHLSADDPFPARRPVIVGRSCHSHEQLQRAAEEGCDYATLSPIFSSPSKPGYGPALGVAALSGAPLPVYALGGVNTENAGDCRAAGAAGVAVMGAAMRAADLMTLVAALVSSHRTARGASRAPGRGGRR
ncbi:MAG: thiamine phosphate synthase [Acidimicrobiales bacterium]